MPSSNAQTLPQTALITGASSGIGLALAHTFAQHGYSLVLVARRSDRLQDAAQQLIQRYGIRVEISVADLAQPTAPQEIYAQLTAQGISVDILVNNAGFGGFGSFEKTAWAWEKDMIQVNLVALTELTKIFLPAMVEKGLGKVLNVASMAGFQPGPYMAIYFATKAYVVSFSEALASELQGTGVTVTALCPGPTQSEFHQVAQMPAGKKWFGFTAPTSETVAEIGYRGLMKGKTVVIPGWTNHGLYLISRLLPRDFTTACVRRVQTQKLD